MAKLKVMISGGGTGGHIFPAIAIANAIKKQRPDSEFLFVGAEGKMEMEKVPEAGYKIVGLPIMGIQRSLTLKNLKVPLKLLKSMRMAKRLVKEFKPDIAILAAEIVVKYGIFLLKAVLLIERLSEIDLAPLVVLIIR